MKTQDTEVELVRLCPLQFESGLTIDREFVVKNDRSVGEFLRLTKRRHKREQYPQGFGEKWGSLQCLKLIFVLRNGREVAFQVDVTSRRDLAWYTTYVDPTAVEFYDTCFADGVSGVCDRLFPLLEEQMTEQGALWVFASRAFWQVQRGADGKATKMIYSGPPGRTSRDWGRGGKWSSDIR